MVLPLIPLVAIAVGAAAGGSGVLLGGKGAREIQKANADLSIACELYEKRRKQSEKLVTSLNEKIVQYGTEQEAAIRDVAVRMRDFLVRNEKKVRDNEKLLAEGVEASVNLISESSSLNLSTGAWLRGVIGSVAAGAGTSVATTTVVTTFGVASTGAAISGLSGAAAQSATLAWLGGGALAAGGGGVALGAMALNCVTIGPGLLVAGLVVNGQGSKAVTQARAYQAKINVEIEKLNSADAGLTAVESRAEELSKLLDHMSRNAIVTLDELEAQPFDPHLQAGLFQRSMILTKGVIDIATTPVIDGDGALTAQAYDLTVRYRSAGTHTPRESEVAVATRPPELDAKGEM